MTAITKTRCRLRNIPLTLEKLQWTFTAATKHAHFAFPKYITMPKEAKWLETALTGVKYGVLQERVS